MRFALVQHAVVESPKKSQPIENVPPLSSIGNREAGALPQVLTRINKKKAPAGQETAINSLCVNILI
jgi:hypothetical protein